MLRVHVPKTRYWAAGDNAQIMCGMWSQIPEYMHFGKWIWLYFWFGLYSLLQCHDFILMLKTDFDELQIQNMQLSMLEYLWCSAAINTTRTTTSCINHSQYALILPFWSFLTTWELLHLHHARTQGVRSEVRSFEFRFGFWNPHNLIEEYCYHQTITITYVRETNLGYRSSVVFRSIDLGQS